ncbi:hypothetical protein SLE2022_395890 [Rubroshorea leprosula]
MAKINCLFLDLQYNPAMVSKPSLDYSFLDDPVSLSVEVVPGMVMGRAITSWTSKVHPQRTLDLDNG